MYLASAEQIPAIDRMACETLWTDVKTLMYNAAHCMYNRLIRLAKPSDSIVILCGKGNNGGDGYALACELAESGFCVKAINVFSVPPRSEAALFYYERCRETLDVLAYHEDPQRAESLVNNADHIVEAVFGTGFSGDAKAPADRLFAIANASSAIRHAADIPGGIHADDGSVGQSVFQADYTYTFAIGKRGLYSYPAREFAGEITVEDIGIPDKLITDHFPLTAYLTDEAYIRQTLKKRALNTNKGDYGRLLAFVGSRDMTGAASLCLKGALRTGVGLSVLASEQAVVDAVRLRLEEPIYLPLPTENGVYGQKALDALIHASQKASACVMGCGLGQALSDSSLISALIETLDLPLILDADALNALEGNTDVLKKAKHTPILTPHPKEFSRLCGQSVADVQANRIRLALDFAAEHRVVLVLKGAATVIALPDGRLFLNSTGNPGLSKGGSGDVLAGMIASFAAQGYTAEESAVCAVYLHGKAADEMKNELSESGFLPSDLPLKVASLLP